MIERINPALAGFDEAVLERWGLKPTAKDTLARAKERGAITPQEISEMISNALAKDRQKMAEVLQEIKRMLQNLNICVTFNVIHTHIIQSPAPVAAPAPKPEPKPKARELTVPIVAVATEMKPAPQQPVDSRRESPFLNARILQEHGLKPEALGILLTAKDKGRISLQQIGSLITAEISQDNEKLRPTMLWITQLLSGLDIKIVIGEVHYKKPESHSPVTSYFQRPEEAPASKGKLNVVLLNSTGLSEGTSKEPSQEAPLEMEKDDGTDVEEDEFADPNGEFVPKFIFDKETGVSNPYYRAVKDHKFLKHEHLLELARRWQMHGDYEVRNTIVVHNLRLSMKIASRYMGRGLDYDDLVQEGNIGLMIAAERFEPEKGFHFTTYATWWVRQHMQRAIQNFKNFVRMPVHTQEALHKILKITCELGMQLQREPMLEEVAAKAGEDVDKVKKILHQLKVPVVSLEELAYSTSSKDSDASLEDITADIAAISPSMALEAKEDLEIAARNIRTFLAAIKALDVSDKQKTAFKMYYGLDGHREDHTLVSIAESSGFGVTRERVRQMNKIVWKKLAEHGIAMDDQKLVTSLKRVHDLENIVSAEADLSTPTEALILDEVSVVFQDDVESSAGEMIPGVIVTSKRPTINHKEVVPGKPLSEDIIRVVGEVYGIAPEVTLGESRPKEIVWVRWVCTYIMREELKFSFVEIGQALHYADHSSVIHNYRSIKKVIERDSAVGEEIEKIAALCGFRKQEQQTEQVVQLTDAATQAFSPIVEHVFNLSCQTFGIERSRLFQKFVRSIEPDVLAAKFARDVTMHLLHADVGVEHLEIARMFDFGNNCNNRSAISVISKNIEKQIETDAGLREKVDLIRSGYTLEPYGSDLRLLKKCQKRLFPKQVEELKAAAKKAEQSFQEKVRELQNKVDYIDLSQRHKDCFNARYSGDISAEMLTYDSLAKPLGLTRARIEQIINVTWKQLHSILEPTDIRSSNEYVQELEKVQLLAELLKL